MSFLNKKEKKENKQKSQSPWAEAEGISFRNHWAAGVCVQPRAEGQLLAGPREARPCPRHLKPATWSRPWVVSGPAPLDGERMNQGEGRMDQGFLPE